MQARGYLAQPKAIRPGHLGHLYDTNVKGTFLFSKAVPPSMKAAREGHILNITSDIAKRVFEGVLCIAPSSSPQDTLSSALCKEVRRHGINVSVVYSSLVDTMHHTHLQGNPHHTEWLKPQNMAYNILSFHEPALTGRD